MNLIDDTYPWAYDAGQSRRSYAYDMYTTYVERCKVDKEVPTWPLTIVAGAGEPPVVSYGFTVCQNSLSYQTEDDDDKATLDEALIHSRDPLCHGLFVRGP